MNNIKTKDITNIKNIKGKVSNITNLNKNICDKIIIKILDYKNLTFLEMRENLYEIFIYNLNIHNCIYYIVKKLIDEEKIKKDKVKNVIIQLHKFLKLFNNNYRPIYHLEGFIFYLCIQIYELQ